MMRNKLRLLVAVIAAFFALAAVLLWTPSEPSYEGRPLRHWLQAYKIPMPPPPTATTSPGGKAAPGSSDAPTMGEAEIAIRAIGTNAFPILLRMLAHRESPIESRFLALARKIPFLQIQNDSPLEPNYQALKAFQVLSTNAGPAVPQLVEIYNRESDRDTKDWVLPVLAGIGPPAVPAIPTLLRTISGTNAWLRENAVRALGEIRADTAEAVPVLIACLRDPDPKVRLTAVLSLRNFGKQAKAAAPALLELLRDPKLRVGPNLRFGLPPGVLVATPTIAEMATNALWEIDPDVAAKAGMRFPW